MVQDLDQKVEQRPMVVAFEPLYETSVKSEPQNIEVLNL